MRPLGSSPSDKALYPRKTFVQVKIKVMFTLEQATKAQRGGSGIAVLFL